MNTQKGFGPIFIIIIILVIAGIATLVYKNKTSDPVVMQDIEIPSSVSLCGLTINSPVSGATVSGGQTIGPVTIEGVVNNTNAATLGCAWTLFEGQAGTAEMMFQDQAGWHSLGGQTPVMLTGEWMTTGPVPFTLTMSFPNGGIELPPGTPLKIVFTEENPSGMPPVDMLELPLVVGQ